MEKFEVKITNEALEDMEKIYEYIAVKLHAPENAMGQYNRIADAILTLDANPERFALFDSEPEHSWRMRRMVVDNYFIEHWHINLLCAFGSLIASVHSIIILEFFAY
jgi:plasmid stabilization system protein ParE